MDLICFQRDFEFDASRLELKRIDKEWLGTQVVYKKATPKELADRYNLKVDRIRRFARAIKKGDYPKVQGGRPTKVDSIAHGEMCSFTFRNSHCSSEELRHEIKVKVRDTMRRRGMELPPERAKVVSQRTLRRYEQMYFKVAEISRGMNIIVQCFLQSSWSRYLRGQGG